MTACYVTNSNMSDCSMFCAAANSSAHICRTLDTAVLAVSIFTSSRIPILDGLC